MEVYEGIMKLSQKKNALRKELAEKGILKREAYNKYDQYKYFSEAQYKALFTALFSKYSLELKSSVSDYSSVEGTANQANGRQVVMEFELIDVETGFSETSKFIGEGFDKGDKAIYKAYTGALKYYLANTFLVATGDDPEKDSPDEKMNNQKASAAMVAVIKKHYTGDNLQKLLDSFGVQTVEDIPADGAARIMKLLSRREGK